MIKILSKNILFQDEICSGCIYVENNKIIHAQKKDLNIPCEQIINVGEDYVFPGFIDIHTHGGLGVDFCEGEPDEILKAVNYHISHGVTSIMPTITSSSFEKTYMALENIEKASKLSPNIIGVHLEGPYFSQKQCGAQDLTYIIPPKKEDYERIVTRFKSIIKRWDYAPETDRNGEFASYLNKNGILPSAGHTDAKYKDIQIAMNNGCRLITHLYSCMSTITREKGFRKLGVLECAYLFDDLFVEIIADGKHLPPELLKLIFKLKDNDKIILISDSLKVAGLKDKYSSVGNTKCVIEDGVCKLLDRSAFAGSIATVDRLIDVCVNEAQIDLVSTIKAATENPARLFNLSKGIIKEGYDADLVVMDKLFKVKEIICGENLLTI